MPSIHIHSLRETLPIFQMGRCQDFYVDVDLMDGRIYSLKGPGGMERPGVDGWWTDPGTKVGGIDTLLVGGLEHQFYCPINIGNFIIPID